MKSLFLLISLMATSAFAQSNVDFEDPMMGGSPVLAIKSSEYKLSDNKKLQTRAERANAFCVSQGFERAVFNSTHSKFDPGFTRVATFDKKSSQWVVVNDQRVSYEEKGPKQKHGSLKWQDVYMVEKATLLFEKITCQNSSSVVNSSRESGKEVSEKESSSKSKSVNATKQ